MGKYNVDLMLAVREQITSHPETHDQRSWAYSRPECGTVCCIAGWAALLDGAELSWVDVGFERSADFIADASGRTGTIQGYAQRALGLDHVETGELFSGDTTQPEALAKLDALIEKGKNQP